VKVEDILQDLLNKLKDQNDSIQKELSKIDSKLEIHLETSVFRVEGYDKFNEYVKATMQELDNRIKILEKYISDIESKKKGVEESKKAVTDVASVIKWVIGLVVSLFALKPIIEQLTKLFGAK
jgi:prefoldin subunit 5